MVACQFGKALINQYRTMARIFVLVLILCMSVGNSFLAAQKIAFHHLTAENGLSQNAVLSLAQDEKGFMWMGTSNGLNRYDGHRFKIYQSRNEDSGTLSANNVLSLLHDSHKRLWVGTYRGLNLYDPYLDKFKRVLTPDEQLLDYYQVYEDGGRNIWAATGKGLFLYNNRSAMLEPVEFPLNKAVTGKPDVRAILVDRQGNIWAGTTDGLLKMDAQRSQAKMMRYNNTVEFPASVSANFITALAEDKLGRIWIGTLNSGVDVYDPVSGQFLHINAVGASPKLINNNIRRIQVNRNGEIWVGTQEGISILTEGLELVKNLTQDDNVPESLSQNSIHALFQDRLGSMWVGTYFGGVNYTYPVNTFFNVLRKKEEPGFLSNNVISSIVADKSNNLWIGTEGGGLNFFDRQTGRFTVYKHDVNNPNSIGSNLIKVVYLDRKGNVWCGTHRSGLNRFDPETKVFKKYLFKENDPATLNTEVLGIYEDSRGQFWVGTTQGTKVFSNTEAGLEERKDYLVNQAAMKYTAYHFYEDDKQRFWMATAEGLYLLQQDKWVKITDEVVNCIQQDSRSVLWFGMRKSGIARLDEETQKLDRFNQDELIGNRNVMGILEDRTGSLWLSTDNGLLKFNPSTNHLQVYSISDGLAGKAFNYNSYLKDEQGTFYFGGFNGITYFLPEQIQSNVKQVNLVLTDLKLFNETIIPEQSKDMLKHSVTYTEDLVLNHNQNVLTIEFALLNFIKSDKNRYAYMLEGYDKNWIYTATPAATYTNLPAGGYVLKVKGANNDGQWSNPIQLNITVLPPFWLTWWAYLIYALTGIALIFVVVRYFFLDALLKKEEELHQVKLNFFTNVSHEIRTHLTLIMTPVDRMLEGGEVDAFVKQQMSGVKHNGNRLLKLVSELMDFRKAETGHLKLSVGHYDLVSFLEDIYNSFSEVSIKKNISFSFIHHVEQLPLYFDREQLEKVFFNLLANAIRFTPEQGVIQVEIMDGEKEVTISVTDNGKGIGLEYIDKIFTNFFQVAEDGKQNTGYGIGLALAKTIVELHKGQIRAESVPAAEGSETRTTFKVELKKGKDHFEQDVVKTDTLLPALAVVPTSKPNDGRITEPSLLYENGKPQTVLIVEDNMELLQLAKDIFEPLYNVLLASNGREGLTIAYAEIPDIIISDIMMPELDGMEMCRVLKTDNRTSHIPIVFLTAKSTQNDKVSGLELGADIYITKPFSTKILELSVRNLLAARDRISVFIRQQYTSPLAVEQMAILPEKGLNPLDKEYLDKAHQFIEERMDDPEFGVEMLSRHMTMSVPVLYKKLKALTGMSVNDFIKSIRLNRAAVLLREQRLNVNEVSMEVGFRDRRYFSQEFRKQFGKTPREYIQDNRPQAT